MVRLHRSEILAMAQRYFETGGTRKSWQVGDRLGFQDYPLTLAGSGIYYSSVRIPWYLHVPCSSSSVGRGSSEDNHYFVDASASRVTITG